MTTTSPTLPPPRVELRPPEVPDAEVAEYAAEPLPPRGRRNTLQALASESAVYALGMAFGRGLGFFLTPILARSFDAREFGILDLLQTCVLLCSMILSLQMESALLRYYNDGDDKRVLASTYLLTQLALGAAFVFVALLVREPLAARYTDIAGPVLVGAAVSVAAGLMWTHAITLLRAERSAKFAAMMISVDTAANLIAVLVFVVALDWGIAGYFAARSVSNFACAAVVIACRHDLYGLCFSPAVLLRFLRFGLPLAPEGFVSFGTSQVGKAFLLGYASIADVGVLAVVNRVATGVKLVLSSLRQAWLPFAMSVAKDDDADAAYAAAFQWYAKLSGLLMIASVLLSRELMFLLAGPAYLEARWLLGFVIAGAVLGALPYIFNIGLLIGERTVYYTIAVAVSSVVVVLLAWALIARFGIIGSPLAGLAGSIVMAVSVLYSAQKVRPIPYNMGVLWAFTAGVLVTAALGATSVVEGPLVLRGIALGVAAIVMLRDVPVAALSAQLIRRLGR